MKLFSITFIITCLFLTIGYAQEHSSSAPEELNNEFVFVLHGLGRSKASMWLLSSRLEKAGYEVATIGYSSLNKTPDEIIHDVTGKINALMPENAKTIHFVGHSLGGLLIRAYLENNRVEPLGRVVLIGTPSQGTELVDKFRDSWWMKLLGPMALSLGTDEESFPKSIADPYYPVGVIAGISERIENDPFLPGQDDGLVPVESTRVEGMSDFIVLETGHSMMRYDRDVAEQTIEFLQNGKFNQ